MRLHEFNDTIVKKEALGAIPAGCFINNFINKKIGQKCQQQISYRLGSYLNYYWNLQRKKELMLSQNLDRKSIGSGNDDVELV